MKNSRTPIYSIIENDLKSKISNGLFNNDDKLLTEKEIAEQYNVSRMTARQATIALINSGYAYRIKNRGVFVKNRSIIQKNRSFLSFKESMKEYGITITSKVLSFDEILPPEIIRLNLKIEKTDKTYRLHRVRFADGDPIVCEFLYLPVKIFPNLNTHNFEVESLYDIIENEYKTYMTTIEETVSAVKLDDNLSKILYGECSGIALKVFDVIMDENKIPIKCGECYFNSEKYSYSKMSVR